MPTLTFVGEMPCPVERLWAFHRSADALVRLSPPGQKVSVEGELEVRDGAIQRLRIVRFGVPLHWIARIEGVRAPTEDRPGGFTDVAQRSPFAAWRHEHRMEATATGSRLTDIVTYTPPFGVLGRIADAIFLRHDVERLFAHRHRATRAAVEDEEIGAADSSTGRIVEREAMPDQDTPNETTTTIKETTVKEGDAPAETTTEVEKHDEEKTSE